MVTVPHSHKPLLPWAADSDAANRSVIGVFIPARVKRRPAKRLRLKHKIISAAAGLFVQAALGLFVALYISSVMNGGIALTVYINGRAAATVSDPGVIQTAVHTLTLVSTELNADFSDSALPPLIDVPDFNFNIHYKFALTHAGDSSTLSDASECVGALYGIVREDYTYAFTVYADNQLIAASAHYDDAAQAVERIEQTLTETALGDGEDVDEVRISTGIRVEYGLCEKTNILSQDKLYSRLSELLAPGTTGKSRVTSSAQSGIDPDIDYGINRVITIDGTPVAASAAPELMTENIKVESVTTLLDYKTVYVESDEYYLGESFVQTEGVAGLESITYDLVMDNGTETACRVASNEVVTAPVDEVIVVGTRELPQSVPTGSFEYPVDLPYEITSYFGEQRAEFDGDSYHYGIDLAAKKGDPIYAADGGKVIYAGYSPSYGLMIELDHGNGLTSVYAHCSKLLFDVGDAVYKGQQIAQAGDTGAATGPHLHFEIRKNGVYVNPLKYLEK